MEHDPKIAPFRLPTHSRDANRKFFLMISSEIEIYVLAKRTIYGTLGIGGLSYHFLFTDHCESFSGRVWQTVRHRC